MPIQSIFGFYSIRHVVDYPASHDLGPSPAARLPERLQVVQWLSQPSQAKPTGKMVIVTPQVLETYRPLGDLKKPVDEAIKVECAKFTGQRILIPSFLLGISLLPSVPSAGQYHGLGLVAAAVGPWAAAALAALLQYARLERGERESFALAQVGLLAGALCASRAGLDDPTVARRVQQMWFAVDDSRTPEVMRVVDRLVEHPRYRALRVKPPARDGS